MEQDPGAGWVTLSEAARRLGKNERTLRLWLKEGRIRGRKVEERGGLSWRVWVEGAAPDPAPGAEAQTHETPQATDPQPELLRVLWERHEQATFRLGYLEAQLERVPALTEGAEATARRAEEEVAAARACLSHAHARIRSMAAVAAALALACAVMGGMLLTRKEASAPPARARAPSDRSRASPSQGSGHEAASRPPRRSTKDQTPRAIPPDPVGSAGSP